MGALLSGIDLCCDPRNPGTPDAEGHYPLGFGLIQRSIESADWAKVNGFSESVAKNTDFVITFYDLSGQLGQIDFATIAWRPDSDDTSPSPDDSPFNSSDFDTMLKGKALTNGGNAASCGCGVGGGTANGNAFAFGTYTFKNSGEFEVTIEMRVTYNGQTLEYKCDPKIIVGT
jgi:hypothetical protein